MNPPRRLCIPFALSMIALALASPTFADEDFGEKSAVELRDLALRNYRANYATVSGVQCKVATTSILSIAHSPVTPAPAVNRVPQIRAGQGVIADRDRHDDEEDEPDSRPRIVRQRAIGSLRSVVDGASGTRTNSSEYRVTVYGHSVRSERYVGDRLESRHIRNGLECSYESTIASGIDGRPLVSRGKIDDHQFRSGPIIDPRDFGASSGMGGLERMLATWDAVSVIRDVAKCGRSGLVAVKVQEPVAVREYRDFINECVVYLDPSTNLLPVIVEHFQQGALSQIAEVTYAKCDWLPTPCFLATSAEYVMPSDPDQTNYNSLAEITAHQRTRFVVTDAIPFVPTDTDKTFRLPSAKTASSNSIESTFIAAPN